MNILVIGSGAREHAICYAVSRSSRLTELYAIPGNYGISQLAECHIIDIIILMRYMALQLKKILILLSLDLKYL